MSFDENFYVNANPDVKKAIADRTYTSGIQHFTEKGIGEGRAGFNAAAKPVVTVAPSFERRDDSVTSALTDIMSKDSPLMRQAETKGLQTANRRGLLNSSMGVQAAQDSAYAAALPIASQQAQQAQQENLANLDTSTRLYLQDQSIKSTEGLQAKEIAYREGQASLDRGLQEKLAKWNLDETQRGSAAQSVLASQELYNNRINNIMANTNLDAPTREAELASAKAFFNIQMDLVQQMYDVSLSWK